MLLTTFLTILTDIMCLTYPSVSIKKITTPYDFIFGFHTLLTQSTIYNEYYMSSSIDIVYPHPTDKNKNITIMFKNKNGNRVFVNGKHAIVQDFGYVDDDYVKARISMIEDFVLEYPAMDDYIKDFIISEINNIKIEHYKTI